MSRPSSQVPAQAQADPDEEMSPAEQVPMAMSNEQQQELYPVARLRPEARSVCNALVCVKPKGPRRTELRTLGELFNPNLRNVREAVTIGYPQQEGQT